MKSVANSAPLNLFYEEPEGDRWVRLDRYPRRILRRIIRGKSRPGGQKRMFLNLCAGLDRIKVSYRINDYRYIQRHPERIACIIGKPHVLDKFEWQNPILFGAAVFSHPIEKPDFFERYPTVQRILVPGEWMRQMWEPAFGKKVTAWPVGIDTEYWAPSAKRKEFDLLLYDKVLWEHPRQQMELLDPIRRGLERRGTTYATIRYGRYRENEYRSLLAQSRGMLFLCEHETQGIAYQQALSFGVPILAWNRGGFWQDPAFFPRVRFGPVSSVPYWDDRCGVVFRTIEEFESQLDLFLGKMRRGEFSPREYVLENLTLERCARDYVTIVKEVESDIRRRP